MSMQNRVNLVLMFLLVPLLLFVTWQAALVLIAASVNRQVEEVLEQQGSLRQARTLLDAIHDLPVIHPDTLGLLAVTSADPELRVGYLEQLTRFRPAVAGSHARLFREKLMQGEVDSAALENAVRLGQWDPVVLHTIIDAGTRYWLRLGSGEQEVVLAAASRRLNHSSFWRRGEMLRLLEERGFLGIVCARGDAELSSACQG